MITSNLLTDRAKLFHFLLKRSRVEGNCLVWAQSKWAGNLRYRAEN